MKQAVFVSIFKCFNPTNFQAFVWIDIHSAWLGMGFTSQKKYFYYKYFKKKWYYFNKKVLSNKSSCISVFSLIRRAFQ